MKKLTAILVAIVLMMNMMVIMTSALDENATAIDITNEIKWITAYDMYAQKAPIVRADAVYIPANDYDMSISAAPGTGIRMVTFTDWATSGMTQYFDDYFFGGDGFFMYDAVWANSQSNPYDHGRLSYKFTVDAAGTYELVFVGAGQIKAENVDNNEKDRGFTFQVDGGELRQVNISDTAGAFRDYSYNYSKADLDAGVIGVTNGVNSQHYQAVYYYGIQVELTAGEHVLDFYHLFHSGEHKFESGNGPRLNYMGAYVQKYLTDFELASYVYPEIVVTTEEETTKAPEPETQAPETQAPETQAPETQAPETQAPATQAPTTEAPKAESGCGSMVGFASILALVPAALVIKKKRD